MRRPYAGDDENAVHMIWHDNPGIRFHLGKMGGDLVPKQLRYSSDIVHPHLAVHNVAEDTHTVLGANGHEICAVAGVIELSQPNRTATAPLGIWRRRMV